MPKSATYPTLYDQCKTLDISFLKKHGYLKADQWRSGTVTWSRGEGANKQVTGSIGIQVYLMEDESYLELDYNANGKPINYKVPLVAKPSNIGKGVVWFFRCPHTGKLCRKLYLVDTYFLHRTAFKGVMYEKQTYSVSKRNHRRLWDNLFCTDKVYEQLYSKHFKSYYNGLPTKRYQKLWRQLQAAGSVSEDDLIKYFR